MRIHCEKHNGFFIFFKKVVYKIKINYYILIINTSKLNFEEHIENLAN